jgi:hypothetical protein
MFRHFALDPTPARIMRNTAPAVYEWAARVWNARAGRVGERPLLGGVPADLEPLLAEAGETHLPMLAANAVAHAAGRRTHDFAVQGITYRSVPTSRYRVWALARLRDAYLGLGEGVVEAADGLLGRTGCLEPLLRVERLDSGHDPEGTAPFSPVSRMVRD